MAVLLNGYHQHYDHLEFNAKENTAINGTYYDDAGDVLKGVDDNRDLDVLRAVDNRRSSRGSAAGGNKAAHQLTDDGFDRHGKRLYDRHSGSNKTGLKAVEKRSGAGAHNWGTIQDLLNDEYQPNSDIYKGSESTQSVTKSFENRVQRPIQLTLNEWKVLQSATQSTKSNLAIRKPGEGCDLQERPAEKLYALNRKETNRNKAIADHSLKTRQSLSTVPITVTFNKQHDDVVENEIPDKEMRSRFAAGKLVPDITSEADFPSLL